LQDGRVIHPRVSSYGLVHVFDGPWYVPIVLIALVAAVLWLRQRLKR
jgi:hypothetical protein